MHLKASKMPDHIFHFSHRFLRSMVQPIDLSGYHWTCEVTNESAFSHASVMFWEVEVRLNKKIVANLQSTYNFPAVLPTKSIDILSNETGFPLPMWIVSRKLREKFVKKNQIARVQHLHMSNTLMQRTMS